MSTNTSNSRLLTLVLVLLGILVLVPLLFMGLGMVGYGMMAGWGGTTWGGHMWGGGTGMTGGMFLLAVLLRLALLAGLVGGGYLLYRTLTADSEGGDTALEELRLAYARGDLSDEEFERRKETLERED
jgi:putative membrane protein